MECSSLKGKVMKIKEGAGYEDKVYDQCVFIELPDGKVIDLFDSEMLVHPDMIGKVIDVTIDVFISRIEKLPEPKYGIEAALTKEGEYKKRGYGHVFSGKIEDIDKSNAKLILDTNIGEILVTPNKEEYNSFQIGDFVKVFASRTDLFRVYD